MDSMIGSDVSSMLNDPFMSVAVVYGAQTTRGLLDRPGQIVSTTEGDVIASATSLTIKSDSLTNVTLDSPITADGGSFKVRDVMKIDDGTLTRLDLIEA